MTEQEHDRNLVEAALRDRNGYARIVLRYEHMLRRYVRRLLGRNTESVDDILQEAFVKAYVNLHDYDRARPFSPWLYRIAHNETMSFLRKRKTQPQVIDGDDGRILLEMIADGTDVNEKYGFIGVEKRIQIALAELGQHYRDVLVLRFLEDKSYDDIADILALPPGTVATRIRRGLERLRVMLDTPEAGFGAFQGHE